MAHWRCWVLSAVAVLAGADSFGVAVSVRSKAEFLAAVAEASDGRGRLNQDLSVTFDADCDPVVVGEADVWNESEKCILDCAGHRICLDAGLCPSGTVVVGDPDGRRKGVRAVAVKGCGKGSVFRNLTVVNHGRLEFDSVEDTLARDCDFINCGVFADAGSEAGGAIKGCGTVQGCGFEGCRARSGGALSGCGYVSECVFLRCSASDGGAIAGATDVFRCEFRGCRGGSGADDDGFGGAIYGGRDIVSCLFVDCSARQGGAVMSDGNGGDLRASVVHCTFIRCMGELDDVAVGVAGGGAPAFMLNCLSYGCGLWRDAGGGDDKYSCYRLVGSDFFMDYAAGDFHPNPALTEDWTDPSGLRFGDCGEPFFACRDLDGYGYQLSSPWPVCPGCYRFRTDVERNGDGPEDPTRPSGYDVVTPRANVNPGHWRNPPKKSRGPIAEFGNSLRNRPPKVVSRRIGPELIDLSELPCVITLNEILHEGEDPLSFVSPWYERNADHDRFFELCGPLKMPKVGVDAGYGCPGELLPYDEDDELRALGGRYGFRPGWFHRRYVRSEDRATPGCASQESWERIVAMPSNVPPGTPADVIEKIPFLFSPAKGKGRFPLVVYVAGLGEQGTDLKKMFRQTGVFDAVREPAFASEHPCHLLAIMPPEFVRGCYIHYPHGYGFCRGCQDGIPSRYRYKIGTLFLVQLYADLVFAIQRELEAKGVSTVDPDAIVLVGLGTGSSAAATMMREYPGRYAGACLTWPSTNFLPTVNRYRPGRWWYAMKESYHEIDDKVNEMADACRKAGADLRLSYYPDGPNWWNRQYGSPEFGMWLAECFAKGPLHGEELVVARPAPVADLLVAKTGPDEATYYGTAAERPGGLPEEVADRRVSNLYGIRYLRINGGVGWIPPGAFAHSPDLETVVFEGPSVTNIADRAFADSPKLNLVVLGAGVARIASDAFDGCAQSLYGATVGVPVSVSYGVTRGTNTTILATRKIELDGHALPVDGLFDTHIFLCDDELGRRLHVEGEFLWSEEGDDGAIALMYLGEGRDVFVPDALGGRPVVALGRWLLHRYNGFEYRILAVPASVRAVNLSPVPRVQKVFAAGALPHQIWHSLVPDAVVYGTTPDEKSGRLLPSPFWKGAEVVVPKGTDPRVFFAAAMERKGRLPK